MGKLAEIWAEYKQLDANDPRRAEYQKKINEIEQYCINKGFSGFKLTKWTNTPNKSINYPENTGYVFFEDFADENFK